MHGDSCRSSRHDKVSVHDSLIDLILAINMSSKKIFVAPAVLKQLYSLPVAMRCSMLRTQHLGASRSNSILRTFTTSRASQNATSSDGPIQNVSPDRVVRPLVPPPREGSGPLLSRRPDRALPEVKNPTYIWLKTLPIFVVIMVISSLAIFNYEKSSSSTVSSILYALRTNEQARELLGDEIYFASQVPWISGELAPMQGIINISFWVKGTKGTAKTTFVALRRRGGFFETVQWSLHLEDGTELQLLEREGSADPLATAGL
jgi:cytochrome c oxidase assembly factor 1